MNIVIMTPLPGAVQTPDPPPLPPQPLPEDNRPVDLWGSLDPPPLPQLLLPPVIETFARETADQMGADPGGLAMAALTVCAAAIPDSWRVQVKKHDRHWTEPARLWVVLVGPPSAKKTPIMGAAVAPLARIDADLVRRWQREHAEWSSLTKEERAEKPEPLQRRVRLGDTTIEAAQEVYRGSTDGLLVHSDELSGWFGALEKYSGSKGAAADRAFWLQAFNGGQYALNRVGRGSMLLENLSASILGGIQPDAIRRIAADAVDDGLLQRFFPIILQDATLGRDEPQTFARQLYEFTVAACFNLPAKGEPLQFNDDAHGVRRTMEEHHLNLSKCEFVNKKLSSHIGKLDGLFARLCVLFHVLTHVRTGRIPNVINGDTARDVRDFMK